ncbi:MULTISPECIES: hypothetical protein [Methylobacterium]|uniref:Uncharacterized protein n=1 Tax=Methylobacterium thuringiense TaxID=1003091 RepID=A0ABQ4TUP0_9HYPH|nr:MULTISPECIES: hypothetical protein [Methylobacterium]GJE57600.1 hypothetical protein EKPJFOCH_4117 [Methylobacterium thuringiense]
MTDDLSEDIGTPHPLAIPATDQPQFDLGAATVTEIGGTQKSVPDALAAKLATTYTNER